MFPVHSLHAVARLSSVFVLALFTSAAYSHQPAQSSNSTQSTPVQAENSVSSLVRYSDLVLVDVVITDKAGPVHGIHKEQFHILEDGHEQAIASFDEHRSPDATQLNPAARTVPPQHGTPQHTYNNVPRYPPESVVNVLLLDGLNTPAANQPAARREMVDYLGTIQRGVPMMIFTLSTRLQLITEYTTDAAQLTKALQSPKAGAQQSPLMDTYDPISLDASANELLIGAGAIRRVRQFLAEDAAYRTDQRMLMTATAMEQLARYLSAIPGRKNLVWFAGSFPIAIDPDDSQLEPLRVTRDYADVVRRVSQLLASARVAVYPIDVRGVLTLRSYDASYRPLPNIPFSRVPLPVAEIDNANDLRQNTSELDGMHRIAQATGGKEYVRTNSTKDAVANAIQDGASYYTIAYKPGTKAHDGKYHKIECRVDAANYTLAYRRGYYGASQAKTSQPGANDLIRSAALYGAPPATQILFQAHLLNSSDPSLASMNIPEGTAGEMASKLKPPLTRYASAIIVDPRTIRFSDLGDASHEAQLEFVLVGYDGSGNRINYLDRSITMKLEPKQFAQVQAEGIRVRMALDLPSGKNLLRIAVIDRSAGHAGSIELDSAELSQ